MHTLVRVLKPFLVAVGAMMVLGGCGINDVPTTGEDARAKWAEVQNQYQRRADLIPNLVATVKGYATQEEKVLTEVTEARAKATQVQIDASTITDPAKFQEFQAAQDRLSGVLGRLMVVVERYPDLKSNQNFLTLQAQLEGTENRIAIARRDYIESAKLYNLEFQKYPDRFVTGILYGSEKPMQLFTASAEAQKAPEVKFN